MTQLERLTYLERRLLDVYDRKLRRCWWCGSWAYGLDDCRDCAALPQAPALFGAGPNPTHGSRTAA